LISINALQLLGRRATLSAARRRILPFAVMVRTEKIDLSVLRGHNAQAILLVQAF
jgi:hypothetical protein